MKSKSKFTVKIPSEIYKGEVFYNCFFHCFKRNVYDFW